MFSAKIDSNKHNNNYYYQQTKLLIITKASKNNGIREVRENERADHTGSDRLVGQVESFGAAVAGKVEP